MGMRMGTRRKASWPQPCHALRNTCPLPCACCRQQFPSASAPYPDLLVIQRSGRPRVPCPPPRAEGARMRMFPRFAFRSPGAAGWVPACPARPGSHGSSRRRRAGCDGSTGPAERQCKYSVPFQRALL